MHRKTLLDSVSETVEKNISFIVAVLVGILSVIYMAKRRRGNPSIPPRTGATTVRPPPRSSVLPSSSRDVVEAFRSNHFKGSKICVTWDTLGVKEDWKQGAEEVAKHLIRNSEVFFLCRVNDNEEKKNRLQLLRQYSNEGLERNRVLFCTTAKGYEAFTRQVNPKLLITHDRALASFLSAVLPYIILVDTEKVHCPNVQTISSIGDLLE